MKTIFAQIIEGSIPSTKLYEDDEILVIEDIHPLAKVHILLMPKEPFRSIQEVPKEKLFLIARLIEIAQTLAVQKGVEDNYRLLTNNGSLAGQTVFHLHFHLIGGELLGPMA